MMVHHIPNAPMFAVIGYRQSAMECEFARHAVKAYTETKRLRCTPDPKDWWLPRA
jgi:hypothetical protein